MTGSKPSFITILTNVTLKLFSSLSYALKPMKKQILRTSVVSTITDAMRVIVYNLNIKWVYRFLGQAMRKVSVLHMFTKSYVCPQREGRTNIKNRENRWRCILNRQRQVLKKIFIADCTTAACTQ